MRVTRFRPCIDLHSGKVKQLVGGTFSDGASAATEVNFETDQSAAHFAALYARDALPGGHVIMIGPNNEAPALSALRAFPGGMHVGGGITDLNAARFLDAGASHVIVTSFVFSGGDIQWDRVRALHRAIGKDRLVLDVSCKHVDGRYVVCTDRWQRLTRFPVDAESVARISDHCDELLVHAVDNEGKKAGIDLRLIDGLASWSNCPVTYAGGVANISDLDRAKDAGRGRVDITIGSALDLFGGSLKYTDAVEWQRHQERAALAVP